MSTAKDTFGAKARLQTAAGEVSLFRLQHLADAGVGRLDRLPFSIRILLENALRNNGLPGFTPEVVRTIANWNPNESSPSEIPFMPARVVLQDFTGVPCVVDL